MTGTAVLYLLPYVAVWVGFVLLHNAWAATVLYHGVILGMWAWRRPVLRRQRHSRPLLSYALVGVCALSLPLIVGLWPWLVRPEVNLGSALETYGVGGTLWWPFFGYIVLVHPVLEEVYWRGMAPDNVLSDVAFAGFHVILVAPFLNPPWIVIVVAILVGAGWVWRWTVRQTGGLATACITHAVADLCILLAVHWLRFL